MIYLNEEEVRIARMPGNVSDNAVAQWIMDDKFIDGRWRSKHFLLEDES